MFQVNSIIDMGVSAYSQLQKLKGQEVDATDSDKAKKNVCVYLKAGQYSDYFFTINTYPSPDMTVTSVIQPIQLQ